MKISSKYSIALVSSIASMSFISPAHAGSDWRLLTSQFNTTASKLVTKDQGTLAVQFNTSCAANYAAVESTLRDLVAEIADNVGKSATLVIKNKNPELSVSTQARYSFTTKDDNQNQTVAIDNCANGRALTADELKKTDLSATTFEGSTSIVIETKEKLADLNTIKQQIALRAEEITKATPTTQIYVGNAEFSLSAEANSLVQADLDSQSTLFGKTRLDVDKKYAGDFKEEYYTEVSDSSPMFRSIQPTIDSEGRSVLSAYYTFDVKFLPANLSNNSVKAPENLLGNTQMVVNGKVTVDTDYYVGRVSLSTNCHTTRASATKAMTDAFKTFKDQAENEIIDTKNQANPERVEISVNNPQQSDNWIQWETVSNPARENRGFGNNVQVVSYLNRCTGEVVKTSDHESLQKTYSSSQSITVITKNFAGLKALEAAAAQYNETQSGATRVHAASSNPSPRLNPRKQYEAVEILAYQSAVEQLLQPQGALATLLLDQVNSSEAYYTLSDYSAYNDEGGRGRSSKGFGAGAPMAPQAGLQSADSSDLSNYSVLATGDENIPQAELNKNKTYSVSYTPNKDLITILNEKRAAAANAAPSRR